MRAVEDDVGVLASGGAIGFIHGGDGFTVLLEYGTGGSAAFSHIAAFSAIQTDGVWRFDKDLEID